MATTRGFVPYRVATYFEFREVFGRAPTSDELASLLEPLGMVESVALLCQMNADFRLAKPGRDSMAKLQREMAGGLLDDETIDVLKRRFGHEHAADRPIFHPVQMLNVLTLVLRHSRGSEDPFVSDDAKYRLGKACLMMSDLLLSAEERAALASGDITRALVAQSRAPFETQNPPAISHVVYRAQVVVGDVLRSPCVLHRIAAECEGFDLERAFQEIVGMPLKHWLYLLVALYTYFHQYVDPDTSSRRPEHLFIDRLTFKGESAIDQRELDRVFDLISSTPDALVKMFDAHSGTDGRWDFVPLRSKPLIELRPGRFFCSDLGFLIEKMYTGAYWAINDGLPAVDRPKLFKAWGILFEEYINLFLGNREFRQPIKFWPRPKWRNGKESFDGALMQDSRFMPLEYKGGAIKMGARYATDFAAFEAELDKKIGEGCRQLARKIQVIFGKSSTGRQELEDIPTAHVTRVVPILIAQDPIAHSPLMNWLLNKTFAKELDRANLRPGITVEPLTLASVTEFELMTESAEAAGFDIFHGVQLRCQSDPEMVSGLHNFLRDLPNYGKGISTRRKRHMDDHLGEMHEFLFGKSPGGAPFTPQTDATR
jgi:hypothetical protein